MTSRSGPEAWPSAERTASPISVQRSTVYAQMTTETAVDGTAGAASGMRRSVAPGLRRGHGSGGPPRPHRHDIGIPDTSVSKNSDVPGWFGYAHVTQRH